MPDTVNNAWRLDASNPWGRRRFGFWIWLLPLMGLAFVGGWYTAGGDWRGAADKTLASGAQLREQLARLAATWPPEHETDTEPAAQAPAAGKPAEPAASNAASGTTSASRGGDSRIEHWCRALAGRLFSVALRQCEGRGFRLTGHYSVDGRPIPVRSIRAKKRPVLGRVLVIGGTHGDELTSVSLTFWWLDMLEEEQTDIDWRVAPTMNPDGVLHHPPQRLNAHGVDLNRNLPTPGWYQASRAYWHEVNREPRRYPGESAASEPETQWLVSEIEHHRPDVIVSLHAPYGVLDYDGKYPPPEHLGGLSLQRLGVFPGSLGNYGSRYLGIPVITVELEDADHMPSRAQARKMWRDLNRWLQRYLGAQRQAAADAEVDG